MFLTWHDEYRRYCQYILVMIPRTDYLFTHHSAGNGQNLKFENTVKRGRFLEAPFLTYISKTHYVFWCWKLRYEWVLASKRQRSSQTLAESRMLLWQAISHLYYVQYLPAFIFWASEIQKLESKFLSKNCKFCMSNRSELIKCYSLWKQKSQLAASVLSSFRRIITWMPFLISNFSCHLKVIKQQRQTKGTFR